ncbi:MAG: metallophosphoesterase, partial [Gammaproteobacteria bacterium]
GCDSASDEPAGGSSSSGGSSSGGSGGGSSGGSAIAPEANIKVAFIGDSEAGTDFRSVLNLIESEGANLVLHQGDFDYQDDPELFFSVIDQELGADFPYLGSIGNHDNAAWTGAGGYAERFSQRMARIGITPDEPNLEDEMYSTAYRGLRLVFVGENGNNDEFAQYLNDQLINDQHIVKICSWHKNQAAMQVGGKGNEMGWQVYENCLQQGAIIVTGHEHSYSRTRTLIGAEQQQVDSTCAEPNQLCVGPGRTFVTVSGLGGRGVRDQERCLPETFPYGCNQEWASIYAAQQGANFGVMFITFNVGGDPRKARGYFKDIAGSMVDEFDVTFD